MKLDLSKIPINSGVYIMKDIRGNIIYVGKAKNLKKRLSQYFLKNDNNWKVLSLRNMLRKIDYVVTSSEKEALILEERLIKKFKPFYNKLWKDSKTYPYIKITNEDLPRILIVRKKEIDGAFYSGPYPKVNIIKKMLSYFTNAGIINLRKCNYDFSIEKPLNKKKINSCLYYQTNQCPAPCDKNKIRAEDYHKLVKRAKELLRGQHHTLIREFENKMNFYSEKLEYEKAAIYRDYIKAIEHINELMTIKENDIDQLLNDKSRTLENLKEILHLKKIPLHIETFDVSGLFGRYAVGSSVCFINGEKNNEHYRHYKIKSRNPITGSNDFLMMKEIVYRRIRQIVKNKDNPPDLIVIDGGKGQLNMAIEALKCFNLDTEIISIAKKFEEIYTINSIKPIKLPSISEERLLIEKMRDEAHRFAITYHRKIRESQFYG